MSLYSEFCRSSARSLSLQSVARWAARAGRRCLVTGLLGLAAALPGLVSGASAMERGFNIIQMDDVPYGSSGARQSFETMASTGATVVAIIPFAWQEGPTTGLPVLGDAVSDAQLRLAIRDAHAAGLSVMVKPHIWVPETWAGAIVPEDRADWMAAWERVILHYAAIAQEEQARILALGTELVGVEDDAGWPQVIARTRATFDGQLTYVAHGLDGLRRFQHWSLLDAASLSIYPEMNVADNTEAILGAMQPVIQQLRAASADIIVPLWIAEVGLMSVQDAHRQPWLSPEERGGPIDTDLQARVLALWDRQLTTVADMMLVWRWFSNPDAGGNSDTDFTVQNKKAERALRCMWTRVCS